MMCGRACWPSVAMRTWGDSRARMCARGRAPGEAHDDAPIVPDALGLSHHLATRRQSHHGAPSMLLTAYVCPLIHPASSERRNATVAAISSGSPKRGARTEGRNELPLFVRNHVAQVLRERDAGINRV